MTNLDNKFENSLGLQLTSGRLGYIFDEGEDLDKVFYKPKDKKDDAEISIIPKTKDIETNKRMKKKEIIELLKKGAENGKNERK